MNAERLQQVIDLLDKTISQKQRYTDALRDDRLFMPTEAKVNSVVVQYLDANLDELRKIVVDLKGCL